MTKSTKWPVITAMTCISLDICQNHVVMARATNHRSTHCSKTDQTYYAHILIECTAQILVYLIHIFSEQSSSATKVNLMVLIFAGSNRQFNSRGLEVINLEYSLKLKIKLNDWLLADMCPQVANHCALF